MVRFWWLLALALVVLAPFVGAGPFKQYQRLSKLASQPGVAARVVRTDRDTVIGRPVLTGTPVQIEIASNPPRQLWGTLDGWANGPLPRIGDTIEIRVDPEDPDVWAVVHKVPSMASALGAGLALVAAAVLPLLVAVAQRSRVLKVWRTGTVREAAVLGQQQTALAPGAYVLRCAWIEDGEHATDRGPDRAKAEPDRAIFKVFVPKRSLPAIDEQDRVVRVLTLPNGGKRVAVDWLTG